MKVAMYSVVLMLVTGCASTARVPELDSAGKVTYGAKAYGMESLEEIKIDLPPIKAKADALPLCVNEALQNRSVTLLSTSTFVGPYTGTLYSVEKSRDASGGPVVNYVSDDRRAIAASGLVHYEERSLAAPVKYAVRFALTVRLQPDANSYDFTNIERAQMNTSIVNNEGFKAIGTWAAAGPMGAVRALHVLAEAVNACLSR